MHVSGMIGAWNTRHQQDKAKVAATSTKPAPILKIGAQTFVKAAAEAINKAITFSATSGKMVLQGHHVSFNVSMVGIANKEKAGKDKETDKPQKGTPEELAQAKVVSAGAQFGHTACKQVQESKSEKYSSLDEPVPKKSKAKFKSVKDAVANAKLAPVDMEDTDDEKEIPVTAKSPVSAFTITAQDSQAPSATGKKDMVSVELKTA